MIILDTNVLSELMLHRTKSEGPGVDRQAASIVPMDTAVTVFRDPLGFADYAEQ